MSYTSRFFRTVLRSFKPIVQDQVRSFGQDAALETMAEVWSGRSGDNKPGTGAPSLGSTAVTLGGKAVRAGLGTVGAPKAPADASPPGPGTARRPLPPPMPFPPVVLHGMEKELRAAPRRGPAPPPLSVFRCRLTQQHHSVSFGMPVRCVAPDEHVPGGCRNARAGGERCRAHCEYRKPD